ncbi:hypothetical protein F5I97DRAFT_1892039 [Phlebopus sp. FC_14]|nr:hypothetical protein F5I97DRAFT_1892039 [Phlebopus sp. FC_14]
MQPTDNRDYSGLYSDLASEVPFLQHPLQKTSFGNVTGFASEDLSTGHHLLSWTDAQTLASLPLLYREYSTQPEASIDFALQNPCPSHWGGGKLITCPATGQAIAQLYPSPSLMGSGHNPYPPKWEQPWLEETLAYPDCLVSAMQPIAHGQHLADRNELLSSHETELFPGEVPAAPTGQCGQVLPPNQIFSVDGSRSHYQCQWSEDGVTCGATLSGDKRDVLLHLYHRHNIKYGSEKLQQRCHWFQCRKTMKRESIPRHIVTVHIKEGVRCPDCGSTFSREDALKRHQRGARQKVSQTPDTSVECQPEAGTYGRICARNTMHLE